MDRVLGYILLSLLGSALVLKLTDRSEEPSTPLRQDVKTGGIVTEASPPDLVMARVHLHVPMSFVEDVRRKPALGKSGQQTLLDDVRQRLKSMGLFDVALIMQDPTDNTRFTTIARISPSRQPVDSDGIVRLLRWEPVEEPPEIAPLDYPNPFDPGLTPDEIVTIERAVRQETNPRHLRGLSSTLEPFFPVSASLLRLKASLLESRALRNGGRSTAECREMARVALRILRLSKSDPQRALSSEEHAEILERRKILEDYGRRSGLPIAVLCDEVKRAACAMVPNREPNSRNELSNRFPPEVTNLARLLVHEILAEGKTQSGIAIIHPARLRLACPTDGREGFVSPSALQLAMAAQKPRASRVWNAEKVRDVLASLESPFQNTNCRPLIKKDQDLLKARAQMERAQRAIERQRWVQWYHRAYTVFPQMFGSYAR